MKKRSATGRFVCTGDSRKTRKEYIQAHKTNNPCYCCGIYDLPQAMDFHHIDESAKSFELGQAHTKGAMTIERIKQEIAKCYLLCVACHRKIHAGTFCILP